MRNSSSRLMLPRSRTMRCTTRSPCMADRTDGEASRPKLQYPYPEPPARGQTLEVAPGVRWIRMPLPYTLNHINLWALDDGDGWALVDTGCPHRRSRTRLARALCPGARCTWPDPGDRHPHAPRPRRHGRLADAQVRRAAVDDAAGIPDCRAMVSDTGREAPPDALRFYRRAGWGEPPSRTTARASATSASTSTRCPTASGGCATATTCTIGAHRWRVIVGSGHSPEHACLLPRPEAADLRRPGAAAHLVERVGHPTEPDADPLGDWLASLARLRREVPDDVLVLPAHNEASAACTRASRPCAAGRAMGRP
jgi:hypothetical protein